MTETADIVVVGGGIVGCSVVYHLVQTLDSPTRIVLCDRGPIAGATSGACMGHLMVTPDDERGYAFTKGSVDLWAQLAAEVGGFDYNPTGALYLADGDEDVELFAVLQRQFAAVGDRADILDQRQLRDLEPGLAADLPGALFYPGDGVVLPMLACGAMLRAAQQRNAQLDVRPECAVTSIRRDGERVVGVTTAAGTVDAPIVVNACACGRRSWRRPAGCRGCRSTRARATWRSRDTTCRRSSTQLLEISLPALRPCCQRRSIRPASGSPMPGGHAVNMQPQTQRWLPDRQHAAVLRHAEVSSTGQLLHVAPCSAPQRYAPGVAACADRAHVGRPAARTRSTTCHVDRSVADPVAGLLHRCRSRRSRHLDGADHRSASSPSRSPVSTPRSMDHEPYLAVEGSSHE